MIVSLFRRKNAKANSAIVTALYENVVAAARQPHLYAAWGVPDTPIGRYESIGLHMIVLLHRTRGATGALDELTTAVVDEFFLELDHSIRELGVGDAGVPKRMKKLGKMFYGRMGPYWKAMDATDAAALAEALRRNVAPDDAASLNADALAHYMMVAMANLAGQGDDALLQGRVQFPDAATTERANG